MILSYHPFFSADQNRICAGRQPDDSDLTAIRAAKAVILNQGCYRSLYQMARNNCRHVFPHYDTRFTYPGKLGQARLFTATGTLFPATDLYPDLKSFTSRHGPCPKAADFRFPLVFKFDWGGEGHTVFLVETLATLREMLHKADLYEKTGQKGFLLQTLVPAGGKSLRVVVVGKQYFSYWRIQPDERVFQVNVAQGAQIEHSAEPELQNLGRLAAARLCRKTGVDLAGFDFLFDVHQSEPQPLVLEINYFFGRRGIGGSQAFYNILVTEIHRWIRNVGIAQGRRGVTERE